MYVFKCLMPGHTHQQLPLLVHACGQQLTGLLLRRPPIPHSSEGGRCLLGAEQVVGLVAHSSVGTRGLLGGGSEQQGCGVGQ